MSIKEQTSWQTADAALRLQPINPNDPLGNLVRLADHVSETREQMREEVRAARARGYSWERITQAVRGHWPNGQPCGLGELFPGGSSTTTVKRWAD